MEPPTDPRNPADTNPTAVRSEAASGSGQFRSRPRARVECLTCGHHFDAHQVGVDDVTRLEGASDPDDLLMIVPLRCPHCDSAGTLTLPYGPQAGPEDEDVLRALTRRRPGPRPLAPPGAARGRR